MKVNNSYNHVGLKYWQNNIKYIEKKIAFKKILLKVKKKLESTLSDRKIAHHIKQLSTQPIVKLRRINIPGLKSSKRSFKRHSTNMDKDLFTAADKASTKLNDTQSPSKKRDNVPELLAEARGSPINVRIQQRKLDVKFNRCSTNVEQEKYVEAGSSKMETQEKRKEEIEKDNIKHLALSRKPTRICTATTPRISRLISPETNKTSDNSSVSSTIDGHNETTFKSVQTENLSDKLKRIRANIKVENSAKMLRKSKTIGKRNKLRRKMLQTTLDLSFLSDTEDDKLSTTTTSTLNRDESDDNATNMNDSSEVDESEDSSTIANVTRKNSHCKEKEHIIPAIGDLATDTESDSGSMKHYSRKRKLKRLMGNDSHNNDNHDDHSKRRNGRNSIDSGISVHESSPAPSPWPTEDAELSKAIVNDSIVDNDADDDVFIEQSCEIPLESSSRRQSFDGNIQLNRQTIICKALDKSPCDKSTLFDDDIQSIVNELLEISPKCSTMTTIDSYESEKISEEHLENISSLVDNELVITESDNTAILAGNDQVILNNNDSESDKLSNYCDESDESLDEKPLRIIDEHLYEKFTEKSSEITLISKAQTTEDVLLNEKQTAGTSSIDVELNKNNCTEMEIIKKAPVSIMGKMTLPSKNRHITIKNSSNSSNSLQLSKEKSSMSSVSQVGECESINSAIVLKNQSLVGEISSTKGDENKPISISVPQNLNYNNISALTYMTNEFIVPKLKQLSEFQVLNHQDLRCNTESSITANKQISNINPALMTSGTLNINLPRVPQEYQSSSLSKRPKITNQFQTPMQLQSSIQPQIQITIPFQPQDPNFSLNLIAYQQPQPIPINNSTPPIFPFNSQSYSRELLNKVPSSSSTIVSNPGPSRYPTSIDNSSVPGPSSLSSVVNLPPMTIPTQQLIKPSQLPYNNTIPQQSFPIINQEITNGCPHQNIKQYLYEIQNGFLTYRHYQELFGSLVENIDPQYHAKQNHLEGMCLNVTCHIMDTAFKITQMKCYPSIDYAFIYAAAKFEKCRIPAYRITYYEMTTLLEKYLMIFVPDCMSQIEIPNLTVARRNYNRFQKQYTSKSKNKMPQYSSLSILNNKLPEISRLVHTSYNYFNSWQPLPLSLQSPPREPQQSSSFSRQLKLSMTTSQRTIFEMQVQLYYGISKWIETELNKEYTATLYRQSILMHERERLILAQREKEMHRIQSQLQNSPLNVSTFKNNEIIDNNQQQSTLTDADIMQRMQNLHAINLMRALCQIAATVSPESIELSKTSSRKRHKNKSIVKPSTSCNETSEGEFKQTEKPQDLILNEKETLSVLPIAEVQSTSGVLAIVDSLSQVDKPRDKVNTTLLFSDAYQTEQQQEPNTITHNENANIINEKDNNFIIDDSNEGNEIKSDLELEKPDDDTVDIKDEIIKNEMTDIQRENEHHETEDMYDDSAAGLADLPNLSIPNIKTEINTSNETLNKSNNNSIPEIINLDDSLDYDNNDCVSIISSDRETVVISRDIDDINDIMKHNQSVIDEELECEALSKKLGIAGPSYAHDNSPIKYDNPVITGVMTIDANAFENIDKTGNILINEDFIDITDIGLKLERNIISSSRSNCSDDTVMDFIGEDIKNTSHRPNCSNCKTNKSIVLCECGEISYCSDSCLCAHWPQFHSTICKGAQINIKTIEEITLDDD